MLSVAFAWNPPIGVCPPEAIKKLDSLYSKQSEGKLTGNNTIPFDNGKCFLNGFDLYVEGNNFGLVNKKTGDKVEYVGKDKEGGYNFNCAGFNDIKLNINCINLGNNRNDISFSVLSKIDTNQIVIFFSETKFNLFDAIFFNGKSRNEFQNMEIILKENKAKTRLEGEYASSIEKEINSDFYKAEGYLKRKDIISAIKEIDKRNDLDNYGKYKNLRYKLENSFVKNSKADIKNYKTVKIGEQIWLAENLNHETIGSECFNYEESSCKKFGRLYTWEAAMKACPEDWHLPTDREWAELMDFAGGFETAGKFLKAKDGWKPSFGKPQNGIDKFGFAALPSGYGGYKESFHNTLGESRWWSSSERNKEQAFYRGTSEFGGDKIDRDSDYKEFLFSRSLKKP